MLSSTDTTSWWTLHRSTAGKDFGPRPKGLLLTALAGCTGMDVVSILNKMRVAFSAFDVEVSGEPSPTSTQRPIARFTSCIVCVVPASTGQRSSGP